MLLISSVDEMEEQCPELESLMDKLLVQFTEKVQKENSEELKKELIEILNLLFFIKILLADFNTQAIDKTCNIAIYRLQTKAKYKAVWDILKNSHQCEDHQHEMENDHFIRYFSQKRKLFKYEGKKLPILI